MRHQIQTHLTCLFEMWDPFRKRTGFNRKKTKLSWGMVQKMYLFLSTQSFIAQISWLI